jgi:hypothetical protein
MFVVLHGGILNNRPGDVLPILPLPGPLYRDDRRQVRLSAKHLG